MTTKATSLKTASPKPASLIPHGLSTIVIRNTCSGYASDDGNDIMDNVRVAIRRKYGFRELGSGAYSIVYTHPDHQNKVIKLTLSRTDGYHRYIEWIERATDFFPKSYQKHLPKIFETKKLRKGGRITVLERLSPVKAWCEEDYHYYSIKEMVKEVAKNYHLRFDLGVYNSMARKGRYNGRRRDIQVITDPWSEL